jgi:diaminopimelate epimerase
MKFTKMQGCGNDYVYVNCFKETVDNPSETAKKVSDRHFGIGSDGLILIKPSVTADFMMDMYNADGSSSPMCGNGIRSVAKYVYDYGLTDKQQISIETGAGIKFLDLEVTEGKVTQVTVDMGSPIMKPEQIPVLYEGDEVIAKPINVAGVLYEITCVSMGNPHTVIFVEDTSAIELDKIGPLFELNSLFPKRTNTEFIHVYDRSTIDMRVWERGAGETLACGTGACASVYACIRNGFTEDQVTVRLLGGELHVRYDREKNTIFMTGPAVTIFDGEINL